MKITSLLNCNVSLIVKDQRITLPAKPSILELDDTAFANFIPRLEKLVEEEGAKWLKKPVLSAEKQEAVDAAELKAAQELVAKAAAKAKAAK
jgi:hypothetical protein